MIISRRSHDLIVATVMASANDRLAARDAIIAELRNQIAELKADHIPRTAHDLIVAELRERTTALETSRNFYRKEWTKSRGKAFVKTAEEAAAPLFDQIQTPAFDDGWGIDDRDLFNKWAADQAKDVNAEELYQQKYGSSPPLIALTV